jgi:MSHA biogenesis protein MshO
MTPAMTRRPSHRTAGFTLVEAIIAIVITGILAGIVTVFISKPIQGYLDSVRRAELTDQADLALRRITRDVRLALPNSLRVTPVGGVWYIEFIMTSAGGRYRVEDDGSTGGDFLSYTTVADTTFDVLGPVPANPAIAAGDFIVIYNLGPGNAPADAYTAPAPGGNRATVLGIAGNVITLTANPFAAQTPPLPSPDARFQVVPGGTQAVTYACPAAGTPPADLTRRWGYGFNVAQPTTTPQGGAIMATLAGGATCTVEYTNNASGRNGLLLINLTLTQVDAATGIGESVNLSQQIRIDNTP